MKGEDIEEFTTVGRLGGRNAKNSGRMSYCRVEENMDDFLRE